MSTYKLELNEVQLNVIKVALEDYFRTRMGQFWDFTDKVAFVPVVVNAKQHPQTNADRIRAMTDEELAGWFDKLTNGCDLCPIRRDCELGVESFGRCDDKWFAWLKSPGEDKDG